MAVAHQSWVKRSRKSAVPALGRSPAAFSHFRDQGYGFCLSGLVCLEHMFDCEVLEPVFEAPPESYDRLDLSDLEWALLDLPVGVGRPGIPEGLDSFEPGRALGVILSTIDVSLGVR